VPSEIPERRLLDIVHNAAAIASYIEGLDAETFGKDRMRRDAVERCLQRISETAVKLGKEAESLIPSQPWQQIRGLGNVLRHGYDIVGADEIWIMAFDQVPLLVRDCQAAIEALGSH
jgi:uncharacterized protein with HEPN domain